ncbi:hypothetical protein F4803DRAFT_504690 [Xylaria telfairii]|nr:hypothetical protein F4803DRAFT_504690 [Xylaria telfairii]
MADPAPAFNALSPQEQQNLLNGPGIPPPLGVSPQYHNPPNNDSVAHGTFAASIILASTFIAFAVYVKVVQFTKINLEDIFALIAIGGWIVLLVYLYKSLLGYGYFVHQWDIVLRDVPGFFYVIYVATISYFIVMATIKAAILLQWIRLFVPRGRRTTLFWTCCATASVNFVASVIQMFLVAFACTPREKYWNPLVEGTCLDANATAFAAPIINLGFDIIILLLPQKVIWNLHLPLKKKLGVATIFALGLLACISAALRIVYSVTFYRGDDRTFNISSVALLCLAESTIGILIYCVPSAPKALAALKRGAQRSTAVLTGQSKSTSSEGTGHSRNIKPNQREGYKELDEVPLAAINRSTRVTASGCSSDQESGTHEGGGIMRTTTTMVSYGNDAANKQIR